MEKCFVAEKKQIDKAYIEKEMANALKNKEFHVYLQPKVNMISGKLCGAEALSRWIHPTDGLRPPYIYIPVFEENGFITNLDMYVFEEVCRLKKEWKGTEYEHITISANMSRLHLENKNFADRLSEIAKKYDIDTKELEIEITENVFIKDADALIRLVDELKERGFLVSIDDFGSGFSALNLLKDLPVDTIKIDREFLKVTADDNRGKRVIKHVIAMCRDLKLEVVTEGIETEEQVDFITRCGCHIAQGFFYSKPVTIDEFVLFAKERGIHTTNRYTYRFNGNLLCEEAQYEGVINGEGLEYVEGLTKDTKALRFPGGEPEKNTVFLPNETIVSDSFTVSMWIKPKENLLWSSAIYIKFESGFASIAPNAWEEESNFRIRDSREVGGWYDIHGSQAKEGEWMHAAMVYNAKTEVAKYYINGECVGTLDEVPTNRYVKWIIIGGDVFRESFVGDICNIVICNDAKDEGYIKKLYDSKGDYCE